MIPVICQSGSRLAWMNQYATAARRAISHPYVSGSRPQREAGRPSVLLARIARQPIIVRGHKIPARLRNMAPKARTPPTTPVSSNTRNTSESARI